MSNYYFDYAATTPIRKEVLDIYFQAVENDWQNPSAAYSLYINRELEKIKEELSALFYMNGRGKIVFTSGATESINTILTGSAIKKKKGIIVTSNVEHSAVANTALFIQNQLRCSVKTAKADSYGMVHAESILKNLTPDTILVSVIAVQNELGTIEPLKEIYETVKIYSPHIPVHVDAAQALGKIPIKDFIEYGDLFSFSGHKIFGPKGIGLLIAKDQYQFLPLIYGGGQQDNLRSGTINYPLIKAFYESLKLMSSYFDKEIEIVKSLRDIFIQEVNQIESTIINTPIHQAVPHIVHFSIPGLRGETLRNYLTQKGIYISSGSACSSNLAKKTILAKLNKEKKIIDSSLRLSLSYLNSKEDILFLIENLKEAVKFFKN